MLSYTAGELVRDQARRIADGLGLPYEDALEQVEETVPQQELANSYQKRWNVDGAL